MPTFFFLLVDARYKRLPLLYRRNIFVFSTMSSVYPTCPSAAMTAPLTPRVQVNNCPSAETPHALLAFASRLPDYPGAHDCDGLVVIYDGECIEDEYNLSDPLSKWVCKGPRA